MCLGLRVVVADRVLSRSCLDLVDFDVADHGFGMTPRSNRILS